MPVETTRDVIEQARDFHLQLRDFYSRLKEKAQKERLKLLLDYMSAHELQLEENLEAFEDVAKKTDARFLVSIPARAYPRGFI